MEMSVRDGERDEAEGRKGGWRKEEGDEPGLKAASHLRLLHGIV